MWRRASCVSGHGTGPRALRVNLHHALYKAWSFLVLRESAVLGIDCLPTIVIRRTLGYEPRVSPGPPRAPLRSGARAGLKSRLGLGYRLIGWDLSDEPAGTRKSSSFAWSSSESDAAAV